jgi:hypothetical protein
VKKLLALLFVLGVFAGTVSITGCGGDTKSTKTTGGGGAAPAKDKDKDK